MFRSPGIAGTGKGHSAYAHTYMCMFVRAWRAASLPANHQSTFTTRRHRDAVKLRRNRPFGNTVIRTGDILQGTSIDRQPVACNFTWSVWLVLAYRAELLRHLWLMTATSKLEVSPKCRVVAKSGTMTQHFVWVTELSDDDSA